MKRISIKQETYTVSREVEHESQADDHHVLHDPPSFVGLQPFHRRLGIRRHDHKITPPLIFT